MKSCETVFSEAYQIFTENIGKYNCVIEEKIFTSNNVSAESTCLTANRLHAFRKASIGLGH